MTPARRGYGARSAPTKVAPSPVPLPLRSAQPTREVRHINTVSEPETTRYDAKPLHLRGQCRGTAALPGSRGARIRRDAAPPPHNRRVWQSEQTAKNEQKSALSCECALT